MKTTTSCLTDTSQVRFGWKKKETVSTKNQAEAEQLLPRRSECKAAGDGATSQHSRPTAEGSVEALAPDCSTPMDSLVPRGAASLVLFDALDAPKYVPCLRLHRLISFVLPVCMRFLSQDSMEAEKRFVFSVPYITMIAMLIISLIRSKIVRMCECMCDLTKPACSKSVKIY